MSSSGKSLKNAFKSIKIIEKYKKTELDSSRYKPETVFKYIKISFLSVLEQIIEFRLSIKLKFKDHKDMLSDYRKADKKSNKTLFYETDILKFINDNFILSPDQIKLWQSSPHHLKKFLNLKLIEIFEIWLETPQFSMQLEKDCEIIIQEKTQVDLNIAQKYISIVSDIKEYLEKVRVKQSFFKTDISKFRKYLTNKIQNPLKFPYFKFSKQFLNRAVRKNEKVKKEKKVYVRGGTQSDWKSDNTDERMIEATEGNTSQGKKELSFVKMDVDKNINSVNNSKVDSSEYFGDNLRNHSTAIKITSKEFDAQISKINEKMKVHCLELLNKRNHHELLSECPFYFIKKAFCKEKNSEIEKEIQNNENCGFNQNYFDFDYDPFIHDEGSENYLNINN